MSVRIAVPLAAAVLVALAFAVFWPSSRADANWTFADVQERVAQARTVTFRETSTIPRSGKEDAETETTQVSILAPSTIRTERGDGAYSLTDFRNQRAMAVDPKARRVTRFESLATVTGEMKRLNIYEFFRDIRTQAVEELPAREIGGKRYPGFLVRQEVSREPFFEERMTVEMKV